MNIMLQGKNGIILLTVICLFHIVIWKFQDVQQTTFESSSRGMVRVKRNWKSAVCEKVTSTFLNRDYSWVDGSCKRMWPESISCYHLQSDRRSNYYQKKAIAKRPSVPKIKVVECDPSAPPLCWESLQLTGNYCSISYMSDNIMRTLLCPIEHCPVLFKKSSDLYKFPHHVSPYVHVRCQGFHKMHQRATVDIEIIIVHKDPTIQKDQPNYLRLHIIMLSAMSRSHFYNELKQTERLLSSLTTVIDLPLYQHLIFGETLIYAANLLNGRNNVRNNDLKSKLVFISHDLCGKAGEGLDQLVTEAGYSASENDGNSHNLGNLSVTFTQFACMLLKQNNRTQSVIALHLAMAVYFLRNDLSDHPSVSLTVLDTLHHTAAENPMKNEALDVTIRDYLQGVVVTSSRQPILTVIAGAKGLLPIRLPHSSTWEILQEDNPILLMVGNENAAVYLKSLNKRQLQRSLITLWDLNELLNHLMTTPNKTPNLSKGPSGFQQQQAHQYSLGTNSRTCHSLGVVQPNLCVCSQQAVKFSNDTMQVAKAEFALGKLNELIQQQVSNGYGSHFASFSKSSFGFCHKLVGSSFSDVFVMQTGTALRTVLVTSLYTPTGHQLPDRISVTVDLVYSNNSQYMLLADFSRVRYGADYNECRDNRVSKELCICDFQKLQFTMSRSDALRQLHRIQFGLRPVVTNLHQSCLFLAVRNFVSSASFYALNVCEDRIYRLRLNVKGIAIIMSSPSPLVRNVPPFHEIFLAVAMQASYYSYAQIWYSYSFSVSYAKD